ncbi:YggT family protein [Curtobacterium sp. MCJR17_055]|nr:MULTISPECIES: YggT family protein [unclassified Curtobacterium]PYY34178.1 YggT family protein [Curtobacterium sp. MCBD17_029]PYY43158.1 YggT family protein [Curtobacterium sp. MCPF17_046]PYY50749.1 YggT family protein [Curtobacterium sp. MCBD17_023]PYY54029.1 YggT family protein [Curtobacterium sp. MCJR17_055]PYY59084.1 YggT family protein [Curtobacterium sp. MCPF17_015]
MFIFTILSLVLTLYFFIMWGRFILDLVQSFNRGWRPQRVLLVIAEFVYTVTDPPIKAVRRVLPPLRLGPVMLDFGWTIVMLVVIILRVVVQSLAYRFV